MSFRCGQKETHHGVPTEPPHSTDVTRAADLPCSEHPSPYLFYGVYRESSPCHMWCENIYEKYRSPRTPHPRIGAGSWHTLNRSLTLDGGSGGPQLNSNIGRGGRGVLHWTVTLDGRGKGGPGMNGLAPLDIKIEFVRLFWPHRGPGFEYAGLRRGQGLLTLDGE